MAKIRLKNRYWYLIYKSVVERIDTLKDEADKFDRRIKSSLRIKSFFERYNLDSKCLCRCTYYYEKLIREKYESVCDRPTDDEKEKAFLKNLFTFISNAKTKLEEIDSEIDTLNKLKHILYNASNSKDGPFDFDLDSIFFNDGSKYDNSNDESFEHIT